MFANLNIYVVIRKYKPTFLLLLCSKNFSNKKIRADTPHTRYQPLELSYTKVMQVESIASSLLGRYAEAKLILYKIVILPNSNNTVHALLHPLLSIIGF